MKDKYLILVFVLIIATILIIVLIMPEKKDNQMKIKSVFSNMGEIPKKYSCDGENINPRLEIINIPKNAKSLALIMHDPDAPRVGGFTHWVIWDIPLSKSVVINENSSLGKQGLNSANKTGYIGPCPPSGTHRYFFTVYALDAKLNLGSETTKQLLEKATEEHTIEKIELVGLYSRG